MASLRAQTRPAPPARPIHPALLRGLAAALALVSAAAAFGQTTAPPPVAPPGDGHFAPGIAYERRHVDYEVEADGRYTVTVELVRRVLNDSGVREAAQTAIPYSTSLQSLEILQAQVQSPDGRTIDLPASAIFEQQSPASQAAPSFSDHKVRVLVYPQVTPGSRILTRIRHTQRKPALAGQFSMLEFVSPHSQRQDFAFTVTAPADLPLAVQAIDLEQSRTTLADGRVRLRFAGANGQAVAPEPGSVVRSDYSPRVAVSTARDGAALAQAYREQTAASTEPTPQVRALAAQLTVGLAEPRAQTKALYDWVRQNIRYVNIVLERGGLIPRPLDTVLANRYGDCKDHASLLGALLRARGIDSTQVLINATNTYWVPDPGVVQAFNHMIVYLPELQLYLDSTARPAAFGELPPPDAGKKVLHVATGQWGQTPLDHSGTQVRQRIELDARGDARVQSSARYTGGQAMFMRSLFTAAAAVPEAQWTQTLLTGLGLQGDGRLYRPDTTAAETGALVRLDYQAVRLAELPGPGVLRLPHMAFGGVNGVPPLLTLERRYPFPCPSFRIDEETELLLPAGLRVLRAPADESATLDFGGATLRYTATTRRDGAAITIRRALASDNQRAVCQPADAARQKAFIDRVRRNLQAQIVYE